MWTYISQETLSSLPLIKFMISYDDSLPLKLYRWNYNEATTTTVLNMPHSSFVQDKIRSKDQPFAFKLLARRSAC